MEARMAMAVATALLLPCCAKPALYEARRLGLMGGCGNIGRVTPNAARRPMWKPRRDGWATSRISCRLGFHTIRQLGALMEIEEQQGSS